jgi:polyisoprenoid-binding protein YceI
MKRLTLAAAALALPLAAAAAPETYNVDPIHSFANFSVDHIGFSTLFGRFDKSSGTFTIDAQAKTASVEMTIDAASVDTGDHERGSRARSRDEHLRSADFFNVAEFPTMTFKSTAVKFSGDSPSEIEGRFTMLGVTKPLTLKLVRWKCGAHPFNKKQMCGGNATGVLKRTDYGMKYAIPAISDEVKLNIGFEAYKQ